MVCSSHATHSPPYRLGSSWLSVSIFLGYLSEGLWSKAVSPWHRYDFEYDDVEGAFFRNPHGPARVMIEVKACSRNQDGTVEFFMSANELATVQACACQK